MTPSISINAGVAYLVIKGMNSNASGIYTTWKGDENAIHRYNGNGNPNYVNDVFKYLKSIQPATQTNYVFK